MIDKNQHKTAVCMSDRCSTAVTASVLPRSEEREPVSRFLQQLWNDDRGQDIAEYAVMLAVILVIVVGTIRLVGSHSNNVFSSVASSIQ